jgi:purine-binding chemotaxis protein CheW
MTELRNGRKGRNGFDWERAKAFASTGLGEAGLVRDHDAIFRERARLLAKGEHEVSETSGVDHLRFRVGPFAFAVRLDEVGSVIRPTWMTQIPGAPSHLGRAIHVAGRIVAVADLAALLGSKIGKEQQEWRVLLVDNGRQRIGLLSTSVRDIVEIELGQLSTVSAQQSLIASFVHGATHDMTLVLDGARLIDELRTRSGTATR